MSFTYRASPFSNEYHALQPIFEVCHLCDEAGDNLSRRAWTGLSSIRNDTGNYWPVEKARAARSL